MHHHLGAVTGAAAAVAAAASSIVAQTATPSEGIAPLLDAGATGTLAGLLIWSMTKNLSTAQRLASLTAKYEELARRALDR